jgi:hypothetical protein
MPGPQGRSCIPCWKAKTKCDLNSPCSRCVKRSIECQPRPLIGKNKKNHGVAASVCVPCRVGKRECDKEIPCERCIRLKQEDKCIPFSIWKQKQIEVPAESSEELKIATSATTSGTAATSLRKRKRDEFSSDSDSSAISLYVRRREGNQVSVGLMDLVEIALEESRTQSSKRRRRSMEMGETPQLELRISNDYLAMVPHSVFDVDQNFDWTLHFLMNFSPMRISEAIIQKGTADWIFYFIMSSVFCGFANFTNHVNCLIAASAYPGQPEQEHNQVVERLQPLYSIAPGMEIALGKVWKSLDELHRNSPQPTLEEYLTLDKFHGVTDEEEKQLLRYLLDEFSFKQAPRDVITGEYVRIPHMMFRFMQSRMDNSAPMSYYLNKEAEAFLGYTGQEITYWIDVRDPPFQSRMFSSECAPVPITSQ